MNNFAYSIFDDSKNEDESKSNSSKVVEFATRLDQVRRLMGFEGWLINIEVGFVSVSFLFYKLKKVK